MECDPKVPKLVNYGQLGTLEVPALVRDLHPHTRLALAKHNNSRLVHINMQGVGRTKLLQGIQKGLQVLRRGGQ
jgi:hypothetical protein